MWMHKGRILVILFASVLFFCAEQSRGQLLYGATGGTAVSDLYIIDTTTGVATAIGPIGFAVAGLAVHPTTGVLYGSTSRASVISPTSLIRIDRQTGAGTLIGPHNLLDGATPQVAADIEFDANGILFGWMAPDVDSLATIDLITGAATLVGDSGLSAGGGGGLGFDNTGTLFLSANNADGVLRTVDPDTGLTTVGPTLSGALPDTDAIAALSVHRPSGVLYGVLLDNNTPNPGFLVTIDTSTGVITIIGQSVNRLDAIAFALGGVAAPAFSAPAMLALIILLVSLGMFTLHSVRMRGLHPSGR